jgi:hypothetical protein
MFAILSIASEYGKNCIAVETHAGVFVVGMHNMPLPRQARFLLNQHN